MTADDLDGKLYIVRPRPPDWLRSNEIMGMPVGTARIGLVFTSRDGGTATQVPRKVGGNEVLIRH